MKSGYRNPEWNEHEGGGINSWHQFGRAIDLEPAIIPTGWSVSDTWTTLESAAKRAAGVSYTQCEISHAITPCDCTNGAPDHIHVQFNY